MLNIHQGLVIILDGQGQFRAWPQIQPFWGEKCNFKAIIKKVRNQKKSLGK